MSCIASVPGGLIIGALGTKMFAFTGGGFCAFPGFIDPSGAMGANYLIYVIIAIVVSSVISFLLTYATYKEDVPAVEAASSQRSGAAGQVFPRAPAIKRGRPWISVEGDLVLY